MLGVKITINKALYRGGQVGDVVNNFQLEQLLVDIKNSIAINVKLEYVLAMDWTVLLDFQTNALLDVGHNLEPFSFSLVRVLAILGVDWSVVVVP